MNTYRTIRFPRALGCALALLVVTLSLTTGLGASRAAPAANELVWVRQADPVINANNDPLRIEPPPDDRFAGSFTQYTVEENVIAVEERYVDHGYEFFHITLRSEFDRPPLVINPPLRYQLTAFAGHSASKAENVQGRGFQFWYSSDFATVDPREVLAYYPWSDYFTGQTSKEWMVSAPEPRQEGDTFKLIAGWWNCAPCNVTWTYKAEPANAVEQLAAEVVAPVVTYQGEEVPPGEVFFPESCDPSLNRSSVDCRNQISLEEEARLKLKCARVEGVGRLLLIMDLMKIEDDYAIAYGWSLYYKMAEGCGLTSARADDDFQLGLFLSQGGLLLTNAIAGQTVAVETPLATATTNKLGAFVSGYNPDSNTAIFQAYSAPLTVQPVTGAPLNLQPHQRVEVTAAGIGPMTDLPHVFLPLQIR